MENIFSEIPENSLRDNVLQYAKTTYGQRRAALALSSDFLVLRHEDNQKWYGLVMDVGGKSSICPMICAKKTMSIS